MGGQFDSAHYAGAGSDPGTDSMHIVRPRKLDARKRANLKAWIKELKKNLRRFNGSRRPLKFQSDYMAPRFAALQSTTRATVTTLGKILLEKDQSTKLPMYCSKTCIQSKEQKKEAQRKLGVTVDGLWGRGSQGALNAHQARNGNEKTSCLTGCALAQL